MTVMQAIRKSRAAAGSAVEYVPDSRSRIYFPRNDRIIAAMGVKIFPNRRRRVYHFEDVQESRRQYPRVARNVRTLLMAAPPCRKIGNFLTIYH